MLRAWYFTKKTQKKLQKISMMPFTILLKKTPQKFLNSKNFSQISLQTKILKKTKIKGMQLYWDDAYSRKIQNYISLTISGEEGYHPNVTISDLGEADTS